MRTKSKLATIGMLLMAAVLIPAGSKVSSSKEAVSEKVTVNIEPSTEAVVEVGGTSTITPVIKDNVGISEITYDTPGFICDFTEKVVSYTDSVVNIYKLPDEESSVVGVMRNLQEATIVDLESDWTYVSFRDTFGYVKNEEVLFGKEAKYIASQHGTKRDVLADYITSVYEEASKESAVKVSLIKGIEIEILAEKDGFIYVNYNIGSENLDETVGYVLADSVKETYDLEEAWTIDEYNEYLRQLAEEEERKRREEEEARLAAERAAAVQAGLDKYIPTVYGDKIELSDDDMWMLACIVKYESGWQPYEGKLAVANVVLNRLKQGYGSISNVIYARYQFSGVSDGNGGPSDYFRDNYLTQPLNYRLPDNHADECMKAAVEAASGVNNIGNFRFFIGNGSADYGSYADYKIIGGHTFYIY